MSSLGEPVLVAVIGGTGVYDLGDFLTIERQISFPTPWGFPSSPITICRTPERKLIAFISRHGVNHEFSPSGVPTRANIAALKRLGVRVILAVSAVGSLQAEIKPRDFILPNQIIDRTKGIRPSTFFEDGCVVHAGFGDPMNLKINKLLTELVTPILKDEEIGLHTPQSLNRDVTLVCMEGPVFSTRAESRMYKQWGGDIINMSCVPEAKLACEAEICYQMICMCTDYDAWRENEDPVTVEHIMGNLDANQSTFKRILERTVDVLIKSAESEEIGKCLDGTMNFSVTKPCARSRQLVERLQFLHPSYFSD